MKVYELTRPITYTGRTLYGLGSSKVTFYPAQEIRGFDPIFFQRDGKLSPINLNNSRLAGSRIEARGLGYQIGAAEHYAPLRFLFPGIRISCDHRQLPHVTNTWELAERLLQYSSEHEVDVPYYTTNGACGYGYPKLRQGVEAFTNIEDSLYDKLVISVYVRFKHFGEHGGRFIFPDEKALLEVFKAQPLGRPAWAEPFAKALWYPHAQNTHWPKVGDPDALDMIVKHRALDILGAIALDTSPKGSEFPVFRVISNCSGHLADLKALGMIKRVSIPR